MRTSCLFALLTSTAIALTSYAAPARAEETGDRVVTTGPKPSLLRTGALTLGLGYVPAAVVGVTSTLPEDRLLLAPVAGPWLDLGERECDDCSNEKLNQLLLVTDGVVQGIGALEIVGAFLLWETREQRAQRMQARSQKSAFRVRFMPERIAGGYGLRATGEF
jgi:hypothetical protein